MAGEKERKVIGIDFGSSQSSIAIMTIGDMNRPALMNLGGGRNGETMPTILALDENDDSVCAVGNGVREKYRSEDSFGLRYVSDFKRYFGGVEVEESDAPDIVDAKRNADKYARLYLSEMLKLVKTHFNVDELDPSDFETCIAHPATWGEDRVEKLRKLVNEIGFPCCKDFGIRTIPEPIAAMQSLRVQDMLGLKFGARPEYFMVIDFGGGTLDICIVQTDILGKSPRIVSTSGNPKLGGREFDDILIKIFLRNNSGKLGELSVADKRELRDKIKEAKEALSANFKDSEYQTQPIHLPRGQFDLTLARQEFYNICEDQKIFEEIRHCIRKALDNDGNVHLSADKISKVVLTGGSSKWPFVREIVAKEFALGGDKIFLTETPFTDVANGCAISVARPDGPPEKKGVWVKWKLLEEEHWREAKCLIEPSVGGIAGRSDRQFLGRIEGTKYTMPYTICLAWYLGFTKDDLVPDTEDGTNEARICVFARGNMPILSRLTNSWRALHGKSTESLDDTYDLYLTYKVETGGSCSYRFELLDRDAAKRREVEIRDGKEVAEKLPKGTVESGRIVPGQESYCGRFGFGERKLHEFRNPVGDDNAESKRTHGAFKAVGSALAMLRRK